MSTRFYTNVAQSGDNILIREINGDQRIQAKIPFCPTMYIPSKKKTNFTTISGDYVEPIKPGTIKETREWLKGYEGVDGFTVYGNNAYYYQWISDEYPEEDIDYDLSKIRVWSIDIECESENDFPHPETALERVNVIAFRDITNNITHVFGLEVYGKKYEAENETIRYYAFDNEEDMLFAFFEFFSKAEIDVLTGWSIDFYDIPYLINRGTNMFGEKFVRCSLSPWGRIQTEKVVFMEQQKTIYKLVGINVIDYLRIYKKYTSEPRENFQLGYISNFEIGETKMGHDEYENFSEFYRNNYTKFVSYCIQDSLLIEKLEAKLKMMELTFTVAYQAHVNFEDVLSQVRTWDMLIFNWLKRRNIVIPLKKSFAKGEKYAGAYVKEPVPGFYKWVVSFDVTSLYPSIIKALNIGVETKVGRRYAFRDPQIFLNNLDAYKDAISNSLEDDFTLSVNGVNYDKSKISFFSELTQKLFLDRVEYKNQLKKCKAAGDKNGATKFHLRQWATKIQLNSLYGAIGNQYFRFFDVENAEAVTLTGQFIIQFVERSLNQYLNKLLNTKDFKYVIYCDTDSVYITLDNFVNKLGNVGSNIPKTIDILSKFAKEDLEIKIAGYFSQIEKMLNAVEGHLSMKREVVADSGIWIAKKRYIVNVYDSEGDRYETPKLKVMGIEIKKAVVPKFCRDKMEEAVKLILHYKDNEKLIDFIENTKKEFEQLPPEQIGCPTGVKGVQKYIDSVTFVKKGCPLHTRGAIVYNSMLEKTKLDRKYQQIQDGDRIKYVLLKKPNPTQNKVIGFLTVFPPELDLQKYFDVDAQWEKCFIKPMNGILDAIGWESERKSSLSSWF